MRVCVLGAGGVGQVVVQDLMRAAPEISSILVGDIDKRKAEMAAQKCGEKVEAVVTDCADLGELRSTLRGSQLVINALPPDFNQKVMKAALENGASYLDMAAGTIAGETIDESLAKQLDCSSDWKKEGRIALLSAGVTPGLTNVIAREGVDSLDHAERIDIFFYEGLESDEPISLWSPITFLRDTVAPPLVFRDGEFVRLRPFESEEKKRFPGGFEGTFFCHEHEEVSTLPRFLPGVKSVEFKMGGPALMEFKVLYRAGLLSVEKIRVGDCYVSPLEVVAALQPPVISADELVQRMKQGKIRVDEGCLCVEILGEKQGKKVRRQYVVKRPDFQEMIRRIEGVNPLSYMTGICATAFAKCVLRGMVDMTGVFPPEALGTRARQFVLNELEKYGVFIHTIEEPCLRKCGQGMNEREGGGNGGSRAQRGDSSRKAC